jgi:hypothetical protein
MELEKKCYGRSRARASGAVQQVVWEEIWRCNAIAQGDRNKAGGEGVAAVHGDVPSARSQTEVLSSSLNIYRFDFLHQFWSFILLKKLKL